MLACSTRRLSSRWFSSSCVRWHENPLGLPRSGGPNPPPQMPRRTGPIQKKPIPNVKRVVAVASGKGGVGKSTVAVNLAFALSTLRPPGSTARLRVGVLDLDIFGPSIPTLMGLQNAEEPLLTSGGALIPLINHGIPTMSMGFLLPRSPDSNSTNDSPVVWRGLMVQKAVQQLLFDVDWRNQQGLGLDILVVDMPPGTGDVPLTLGQLVVVDGQSQIISEIKDNDALKGAVIVSTPQDVALADVSKGIAMLRKIAVPITGIVLNQSHFLCPGCETRHYLYGSPEAFQATAARLGVDVLAELPLVPGVSQGGDGGLPYGLMSSTQHGDKDGPGGSEWLKDMKRVAEHVWQSIAK
ncbi:P-loop containing nucleoside triphosphate hydrolase protein [Mycena metata]|uniref:P-loop containing nucleoside triphosphate hydrolase protein n=1 Tax=Mycena metata TaxID=1033252 RepID=A0AAD7IIT4_9AGAR|nr:P-loop containing nucleoside triphosphate hydrolase protein [Mycena metata]